MAEDLWKIRERKQMSVAQLALRSGLKQDLIDEYEEGRLLTSPHRAKLAKVLYVNEDDIKRQSAPRPKREKPAPPAPVQPKLEKPLGEPTTQPVPKPVAPPKSAPPVRQGQIDRLNGLAAKLGLLPQQMEAEIGRPFSALTAPEATHWIRAFQARLPPRDVLAGADKPIGYRSKRARLPEGIDLFEANYLLEVQQANAALNVKLFNGETFNGRLIGFGPYTLTLQTGDGQEVTLSKLAIAYYRRETSEGAHPVGGAA